jgi:hypothetical protein
VTRGPHCGEGSPSFLDWSGDAITFSREDHPNRIPNPGQYPLVVDPVIGNARFSKVPMDGGSSFNILYVHTLRLMGIGLDQLRPSTTPFHGVAPDKRVQSRWQWVNPHRVWTPQTHPRGNNMTPRVSPYTITGGGISPDPYPDG